VTNGLLTRDKRATRTLYTPTVLSQPEVPQLAKRFTFLLLNPPALPPSPVFWQEIPSLQCLDNK